MTVIALKTERAEISEAAIELLEQALEEVREGRVVAVGLAVVHPDGGVTAGHTPSDGVGLLGAATLLVHRIVANLE